MPKLFLITIITLFFTTAIQAQKENSLKTTDSLSTLSYEDLKTQIRVHKNDTLTRDTYLKAFVKKAKREKDTVQLLDGYLFTQLLGNNELVQIKYGDSIIAISQNEKYHKNNVEAHFFKALYFMEIKDYKQAFDAFIKTKKQNKLKDFDKDFDIDLDYYIGLIKNKTGNYNESIILFKNSYKYYLNKNKTDSIAKEYAINHLPTIVDAYLNLNQLDSATYYNNILRKNLKYITHKNAYTLYLLNEGDILELNKAYHRSIDTINKSIPILKEINELSNLQFAYYYLGLNYNRLNNDKKSISNFKKVDSIFTETQYLHPTIRDNYEFLINHYRKTGDNTNELLYVNQLLRVDSMLNDKFKVLSSKIYKEYDTPLLLEQKQNIITQLNEDKSTSYNYIKFLAGGLILVMAISWYFIRQNKKNKAQFKQLLLETEQKPVNQPESKPKKALNINPETVNQILKQLENFENTKAFTNQTISLNTLAKTFNTNQKYLSQIINYHKQKNFANYINELRIDYAVQKLKNEPQFRNYTIKAIGNEVGFSSTESFTNAFYKITKIKPSFFLKELEA